MKDKRILIFCTHPDDELLVFGPTLINLLELNEVKVVLVTTPNFVRLNDFYRCMEDLNCDFQILGLPDADTIANPTVVDKFSKVILNYKPDCIITHNPLDGDLGKHLAHLQTGCVVGHCVHQLNDTIKERMEILYIYTEGYYNKKSSMVYSCNKRQWDLLVKLLNKHYLDEYLSLERNIYPVSGINILVRIERNIIDSIMLRILVGEEILENDLAFLVNDPWFTKTSNYEIEKRSIISDLFKDWVKDITIDCLLDIGTGFGLTLQACINIPNIKNVKAYEASKFYHSYIKEIKKVDVVLDFSNLSVNMISFFQSVYYFSNHELLELLDTTYFPKYIFVEAVTRQAEQFFLKQGYTILKTDTFKLITSEKISRNYDPIVVNTFKNNLFLKEN